MRVRYSEWSKLVDAARKRANKSNLPAWSALVNYYDVCIPSIITELSTKLWTLYQRIGGTKNETYSSYYNLPAFWVDACAVIDQEIARIDKIRMNKAQREERQTLRRLGQTNYGNK